MKNQPVVVFVADADRSQAFAKDASVIVFGADNFRNALSQVIFSYPDVVVLDARDNVMRAEDTLFHLRTIEHPAIVILSDVPQRWDTVSKTPIIVLGVDSSHQAIEQAVLAVLAGDTTLIS